ncbi:Aste57867_21268 [Aphanomyces stellatus]|uniref:Aste57867_21268 protein n=1 Tax=Aphanomyces stellatus TaxID=120398 RepID=A0A485LJ66_9STRA|nr:hypothetical protein As57867_021199 [Aphanomyces stellatus]VFT97940.1 Aste57867_21268 [Aphanomyces stellatus]
MAAVSPHEYDLGLVRPRSSRRDWLLRGAGLTSVAISTAMTAKYMTILHAFVQNDYFWTDFNASGAQTFVSDVFNNQLWNTTNGPRDLKLFSIDVATEKDYSLSQTPFTIHATDTRRIIMEQFNDISITIAGIRVQPASELVYMFTCYCWLDFDHEWEVAHTAARQARCLARYANNGAVYLEATLRNTDWANFQKVIGSQFQVAYGNTLQESPSGVAWLNQTTTALSTYSIQDEIQYWIQHNVTQFTTPWQNGDIGGFDNAFVVRTALMSFSVPLNYVSYRSTGAWTSHIASGGVWNDLGYAVFVNASLVRNASNSFAKLGPPKDRESYTGGYPDTPWIILFHDKFGPLSSVDLLYTFPPPSLLDLYNSMHEAFLGAIQTNDQLNQVYHALTTTTAFDMVPPNWNGINVTYFGGNPFCYSGKALSYVQQSFGYDDTCSDPYPPLTLNSGMKNIVLALWLQANLSTTAIDSHLDGVCALNQVAIQLCTTTLKGGRSILAAFQTTIGIPNIAPAIATVTTDVIAMNISLVQYASWNSIPTLLQQPLLSEVDVDWSFYGWLHILDWLEGTREVVAFEGDVSTFVLISKQNGPLSYIADPLQTPARFSYFLWLIMCYTCGISAVVLFLALSSAFLARGEFCGQNLFFANPVVGVIWIGRPLMMIRGITAIVVLCSAPIQFQRVNGFARISIATRSFLDIAVTSGETIWFTFALNDILSVVTNQCSYSSSLYTCAFLWVTTLIIELVAPFNPSATLNRSCVSYDMDTQLSCVSGVVEIGSSTRFLQLCVAQIICIGLAYLFARLTARNISEKKAPVVIPAIAAHLFVVEGQDGLYFDPCSSVLCGLLPFHIWDSKYIFSIVLWVLISVDDTINVFRKPNLRVESTIASSMPRITSHFQVSSTSILHASQKLRAVASVIFLICSAISSALFFYVVQNQLSNDFMWAGFNSTGMQPFVLDWYNYKLAFEPLNTKMDMGGIKRQAFYNKSSASVAASEFYVSTMQFEALSLRVIIQGLQTSDACQLPWIATQLCWVDFNREWELANSIIRQRRCQDMTANGAVFVESVFRNVNLDKLKLCWGDSIENGLFRELRQSTSGRQWMSSLGHPLRPADEVEYWISMNITQFVVQWQNYKTLGVVETASIQNAFGFNYPLTLKSMRGAYRFESETSMKMYWGWGSDLWSVTQNDTRMGHRSLIRSSAIFAFENNTAEEMLMENQTISTPMDAGLDVLRGLVGPFGSIDVIHIGFPPSLLRLYNTFSDEYTASMLANVSAQIPVSGVSQSFISTASKLLKGYTILRGGNILCPKIASNMVSSGGLLLLYSRTLPCENTLSETVELSLKQSSLALISWGAYQPCPLSPVCGSISEVCGNSTGPTSCRKGLNAAMTWVSAYMPPAAIDNVFHLAGQAKVDIAPLAIEVSQYAQKNASAPIELLRIPVMNSGDPAFDFVAWLMLVEWVTGYREVISLRGDFGSLTVISSGSSTLSATPNSLEIPNNVSYYCQLCIQYTTVMVFLVTFFALFYAVCSRGHIEGLNMLEINRVGGIVWVGRPLLFLRSVVAILFLATAKVELQTSNYFTVMARPPTSGIHSLSTILAGSETCWLVIVLTDLFMAVTKDHTNKYSLKSSVLATIVAIILSSTSPVTPQLTVARTCEATQIDFQLTCHAGVIQIGSYERTLQLLIMTSAVVILCFAWEYWRHPTFKLPSHRVSLLLPAGAHYLYHKQPWIFHNTLYLDKASAFLCGLVSFKYKRAVYILDIKTWRTHTIEIDSEFNPRLLSAHVYDQGRIEVALPMVE